MADTDHDLMRRIGAREETAFTCLTARYRVALRRHLTATIRDGDAAEDLLQEAFLRVWTRADQWDGRGAVKAWLFRIATNLALNHLRSRRRRREQSLEAPREAGDDGEESPLPAWLIDTASLGPEAALEAADRAARLRRLVDALPEEKREVFRLVLDADMEVREVAAALGIPEGTVKSRLHHAKKRLIQEWEE